MSTETKSLAEVQQDIEQDQRAIQSRAARIKGIFERSKDPRGSYTLTPSDNEDRVRLEAEIKQLSDGLGHKQTLFHELMNEQRLAQVEERLPRPVLWSGLPADNSAKDGGSVKHWDTLGQAVTEAQEYKTWDRMNRRMAAGEITREAFLRHLKATLTSTGLTLYERPPGVVTLGLQRPVVADLLAQGQTEATTIRYLREDTITNAVAAVAEEGLKPTQDWDVSEQDAPVKKIGAVSKVTDELWMDYLAVRSYINARFPELLKIREEAEILSGAGGNSVTGILNTAGIQTQAAGTDTNLDALYKGITKVRFTGFYEPNGIVINPNNWQAIRLAKTTIGDYIYGAPHLAGPETVFGITAVITTAMTAGTALVGSFNLGAQIFFREGVRIEATNSNENDFNYNRISIRVEERFALAVYRPAAFCTVSGLAS